MGKKNKGLKTYKTINFCREGMTDFVFQCRPRSVYVGNLKKNVSKLEIKNLFEPLKVQDLKIMLQDYNVCATKICILVFYKLEEAEEACKKNGIIFQGKKLLVFKGDDEKNFNYTTTLLIRNIGKAVSEEDLYDYFNSKTEDVDFAQKPAHNYAYVHFKSRQGLEKAFKSSRSIKHFDTSFKMIQVSLKAALYALVEPPFKKWTEVLQSFDAKYVDIPDFCPMNQLRISNVPLEATDEDVKNYFRKFGTVIDLESEDCQCNYRKQYLIRFSDSNEAEKVFLYEEHGFQGHILDVIYPFTVKFYCTKNRVIIPKTHPDITIDELFSGFSEFGEIAFIYRSHLKNGPTVIKYGEEAHVKNAIGTQRVAQIEVEVKVFDKSFTDLYIDVPEYEKSVWQRLDEQRQKEYHEKHFSKVKTSNIFKPQRFDGTKLKEIAKRDQEMNRNFSAHEPVWTTTLYESIQPGSVQNQNQSQTSNTNTYNYSQYYSSWDTSGNSNSDQQQWPQEMLSEWNNFQSWTNQIEQQNCQQQNDTNNSMRNTSNSAGQGSSRFCGSGGYWKTY